MVVTVKNYKGAKSFVSRERVVGLSPQSALKSNPFSMSTCEMIKKKKKATLFFYAKNE